MSTPNISQVTNPKGSCPKTPYPNKRHVFKTLSRTPLPKGDPDGDWLVKEQCKFCAEKREYKCIFA